MPPQRNRTILSETTSCPGKLEEGGELIDSDADPGNYTIRGITHVPLVYVDGQSIGNEQRQQSRKAKIAFVYQRSESGAPTLQDSRVYFKDIGDKTNNEAEYHALLAALWYLSNKLTPKGSKAPNTRIFSDSKLLVGQVNGDWKAENPRLRHLQQKAVRVIVELQLPRLVWVPREQNYAGHWLEGTWRVPSEVITWNYY